MRGSRYFWLTVAALGLASAAPAKHASVLPFIHDDYPRALKEARARKLPIFIETSAPW
ncbi:MAG TPA: hypothetical protein VFQ05_15835 [Candidatus Eisenbacteria bacterium]|jgi:hypothetical protein|nr:hypothetical protein [Candidatus Eisenbacteria bacterium]